MKELLNILKQKKVQLFFLFYILLLVPLFCPMAQNLNFLDKVAIFVVCGSLFTAISVLSLFISSRVEKFIYSLILTISIIPGSIYLAYLLFAHVLLEQNSVTSLFETNPEESKEFIAYYLSIWVIVGVLIYAAIPIVMICKMKSFKPLSIKKYKTIFITSIVAIITIISFNGLSQSVYFLNFYKTFISYKIRTSQEIKAINQRQSRDYKVEPVKQDTIPQTIVLIIGESLNKHHMSLYGYQRNTNPLLSQLGDSLIYYNDIVSPQVHTIPVMRSILSMTELDNPDYFTERPSLFELFNRAGYETNLITNQAFSEEYRSSYDILLTLAHNKYNLSVFKQNDDICIPVLNKVLEKSDGKNRLIVIHLIGNHMAYEFRYPKEYIKFNYKKDDLVSSNSFRDDKAKRTIDKYDNSVLYNDFVIHSIIDILKGLKNQHTALVYFSDHGEEMYEYREFAGHAYEKVSPSMCEIPFMVWMSPLYKTHRNDLVWDVNRPYSTADFIYSISDLAGLQYTDYDDTRSLFSSNFKEKQRYVGEKKYESIKEDFN